MPVSIISNSTSAIAGRNLDKTNAVLERSVAKVSSGQRVFSAEEDAAALSIGLGLRVDVSAFRAAQINIGQGNSVMQIADGALSQITEILVRMDVLSSSSMSDQLADEERAILDTEFQQLMLEIDRIADSTEFNGIKLFGGVTSIELDGPSLGANVDAGSGFVGFQFDAKPDPADVFEVQYISSTQVMTVRNITQGVSQTLYVFQPQPGALETFNFNDLGLKLTLNSTFDETTDIIPGGPTEQFSVVAGAVPVANVFDFQIGSGTQASDRISLSLPQIDVPQLGLGGASVDLLTNAFAAKSAIRSAADLINTARSILGSNMNRLDLALSNLRTSIENIESSRSELLDVDIPEEVTRIANSQALLEAGISMLTQSNQLPRLYLRMLEG